MTQGVRQWSSPTPINAAHTLSVLNRGRYDPVYRVVDAHMWRTAHTPNGPVTLHLHQVDEHTVDARAWGAGATWQLHNVPQLLGHSTDEACEDPLAELTRNSDSLRDAYRRYAHLRVPSTQCVFEALVFAVLEQKVVGLDAIAARNRLLKKFGTPAPGPAPDGMYVPPSADEWRQIPSWEWHRAGVDPQRSRTIVNAARYASRIEEVVTMNRTDAYIRLQAIRGIGAWTSAEIAKTALGDTDAVSVGDYHLGRVITWAFTGRMDGTDADMLELLEPFRPHRQRVVRLLELTRFKDMPRRGPRMTRVDHRNI
ncbi:MAG: hypothetical protein WAO40_10800 [Candidatus Nanopelagicales bacterium]